MQSLATFITTFVGTNGTLVGKAIIYAGIIIAGIALAVTKRSREWAKEHILWLVISAVLILGATTFSEELFAALTF